MIQADMHNNGVVILRNFTDDGLVTTKHTTHEVLKNIFMSTSAYASPLFSEHVVKFVTSEDYNKYLVCRYLGNYKIRLQPGVRIGQEELRLRDEIGEYILFPNYPYLYFLIVQHKNNNQVSNVSIRTFSSIEPPRDNTVLHPSPLPNVYGSGDICWGTLASTVHAAYFNETNTNFSTVFNLWLDAQHNNDLYDISHLIRHMHNVQELLNERRSATLISIFNNNGLPNE